MKRIWTSSALLLAGALAFTSCSSSADEAEMRRAMEEIIDRTEAATETGTDATSIEDHFVEEPTVEHFTSAAGKFSIDFPGKPEESTSQVPTELGTMDMVSFMWAPNNNEALMVAYSDYPEELTQPENADVLLEGGKEGALGSLGVIVPDKERDLELDGHPGKYFRANNTGTGGTFYAEYEMYLVGNRLYQIAILRNGKYPSKEETDAFIGSFKLND